MRDWVPPGYLAWADVVERVAQVLLPKKQTPHGSPPEDVAQWLRDLLAEENPKLVAMVQHRDGEREELSVEFWRSDLAPSVLRNGTLKQDGPPGAVSWDRPVLVRESDLEKLLPHRMTVDHEQRCRKWLRNEVMKGSKQKPRKEYFKEAKRDFNISERQFLRIWHEVVPSEWKTAGRPAKRCTKSPH